MKRNGFTLVEILAVIVIIALLMILTIPNILKISRSTKEKAYETKIDLIEQSAVQFAMNGSNRAAVMKGSNPLISTENNYIITITEDPKTGEVTEANFKPGPTYSATEKLPANTYRAIRVTVDQLVGTKDLNWDSENQCDNCTNKEYYNNIVINPKNNYIINKCYVYIYYKYSRPYAHFDRTMCDELKPTPTMGNQYAPARKN